VGPAIRTHDVGLRIPDVLFHERRVVNAITG
jgi:hypothetical protein